METKADLKCYEQPTLETWDCSDDVITESGWWSKYYDLEDLTKPVE